MPDAALADRVASGEQSFIGGHRHEALTVHCTRIIDLAQWKPPAPQTSPGQRFQPPRCAYMLPICQMRQPSYTHVRTYRRDPARHARNADRVVIDLDGRCRPFRYRRAFLEHMLDQVARPRSDRPRRQLPRGSAHRRPPHGRGRRHRVRPGPCAGPSATTSIRVATARHVPLDGRCHRVVVDFSDGPASDTSSVPARASRQFDVDLIREFFQGFVNHAQLTLHLDNLRGRNARHRRTLFKAFGRACAGRRRPDPRMRGIMPSTKGAL